MTSKLKCPFCGEKLYRSDNCYVCLNDQCIFCDFHFMEKRWNAIIELKQALIQSQKDLKKAIGAFECILEKIKISKIVDPNDITIMMIEGMCEMTLEQIEHKDEQ